jgi:hypothetical protein
MVMTKDEKLSKVLQDFSLLPEDKQNYVLGILQALVFASDSHIKAQIGDAILHTDKDTDG